MQKNRDAVSLKKDDLLSVGVAETDITPPLGTHLAGDARRLRRAEKIVDPLYCRVLIAEDGDQQPPERICLIVLDLCTPGNKVSDEIRAEVAEHLGIGQEAVMLHLTQNHSAPAIGGHLLLTAESPGASEDFWWTYQGDPAYFDFLKPRILETVDKALSEKCPVEICVSGMADARATHNRRFVMRDGWVQTQANDRSQILQIEGPVDPEVGVACFRDAASGRIIASLLHYTAHPVSYFGKSWVSGSWPGAWAQKFQREFGEQCVPLVINGCCGNINKKTPIEPDRSDSDDWISECLMETTRQILEDVSWEKHQRVGALSQTFQTPFNPLEDIVGEESLQDAHNILEKEPYPRWTDKAHNSVDIEWLFSLYLVDMNRRLRNQAYSYEVQAFRIGPLALPGLIGEPFVEGQLRLKMASPAKRTFVAHMCNGWIGYIPPREYHHSKHYLFLNKEGKPVRRGANFFLLAPDTLDRITETSTNLLERLFAPVS